MVTRLKTHGSRRRSRSERTGFRSGLLLRMDGGYLVPGFEVTLAKMGLGALTPGANEIVIEACANNRTGKGDEASGPFLDHLGAGFGGNALNDARHKAVDHFFFQQLAADV